VGALIISLPLLTVADIVGLFGGVVMAVSEIGHARTTSATSCSR
jgi:ABC-type transporter Mla maintaining outer membrane lipid asymmetry permease subunit MlaE